MGRKRKLSQGYLAEQREEEDAWEKELDRIIEEKKEKKLAEKDSLLRLDGKERKQRGNEVMCTRKVQESLQRKGKDQEEGAME